MNSNSLLGAVSFDEISWHVSVLHQVLAAFGLTVAADEVEQSKAGPDTVEKLRMLQKQLPLPVDDDVVLSEAGALALTGAIKKRGLLDDSPK